MARSTRARNASKVVSRIVSRMREKNPDSAFGIVTGDAGGGWYDWKKDHWPSTIKVKAVPPDAKIPWPIKARVFYEDALKQRPFIYWPLRQNHTKGPTDAVSTGFQVWGRIGQDFEGLYSLAYWDTGDPARDLSLTGDLQDELSWLNADIVRGTSTQVVWAEGSILNDSQGGSVDLVQPITALAVDSLGGVHGITDRLTNPPPSEEDAYFDGYFESFGDPFAEFAGDDDCINGGGNYDPDAWYVPPTGPELPEDFDTWPVSVQNSYLDGHYDGWVDTYNDAFEAAGCTIP